MVNNMDHGLPKFSLLGYDDWKIMMEAHLYALHDSIFKTLDPITFSKIKHFKTAMEIWQGLGKLSKMKIVGANVHFQKLEAKCSSPAFYQTYLEMIAAQELSEFLHLEIGFKYEEEVLDSYKNGKVTTVQSKKNPQRTISVIKSTVGGTKVKISQKKLKKKLHLPNSGIEIGKLSSKNLDWKTIGISRRIPSGPTKKTDLKNDYKLVLELVIACLECGSGGHADDITQERAFIINALITRTKVNWAKHFFNSVSKHLGKPKQKYLCQGLYFGYILESLGVASESKKYDARYWLYYLSSKGENRASSAAEDEGSSNNVLILYYDWRAWKVGNSADQLHECDQQLKNENIIKRCLGLPINYCCEQILDDEWVWQKTYEDLHLEYLATSPTSEFESDDEDPAVYKPILSKPTEDHTVLTTEAQADMETTAEDFQVFPETSPAFETVLPEAVQENAASPLQEQNQETSKEELQQFLQSQVQEILTTPFEVQRSFEEAEEGAQIARLEASEPPVAIFEQQAEDEVRDSLSREISNYGNEEIEEESVKTLKVDEEEAEQGDDAESLSLQLFHRVPSSNQVNFHFHSSSATTLPDEIPETWTRKVQGLIEFVLKSQHASFMQEIEQMETRHNQMVEKSEEKYCSNLYEISKSVDKTLEIISLLKAVGTIPSHFTNDSQTEERYNNLKCIQEECGVMQGIEQILEPGAETLEIDHEVQSASDQYTNMARVEALATTIVNGRDAMAPEPAGSAEVKALLVELEQICVGEDAQETIQNPTYIDPNSEIEQSCVAHKLSPRQIWKAHSNDQTTIGPILQSFKVDGQHYEIRSYEEAETSNLREDPNDFQDVQNRRSKKAGKRGTAPRTIKTRSYDPNLEVGTVSEITRYWPSRKSTTMEKIVTTKSYSGHFWYVGPVGPIGADGKRPKKIMPRNLALDQHPGFII
ncbi:unnamed protein product [Cuscuta campestris]|uniref:Uncharacterized protein n=1 Tax=Cuscuta campestris TaxID=132261 RepID=A0A484MT00_9ASTE|nr:unnamed protein product [Cuscuta campestris]